MASPTLFLHVGHPKTGSSALQSSFVLSMDALAAQGIVYPSPAKIEEARDGKITSGNCNPHRLAGKYKASTKKAERGVLLSNEACFRVLPDDRTPLDDLKARKVPVRVLMFVRDPIEVAVSSYIQAVKRSGATKSFADALSGFRFMARLDQFLDICAEYGFEMDIRNYSRLRDRLLPETEDMLGVPAGTLRAPPVAQVNRSLTRSELEFVRLVNGTFGAQAGSAISDTLCNTLTDIRSQKPALDRASFDTFVERIRPVTERINTKIPSDAALHFASYDETFAEIPTIDEEGLSLSQDQARVITEALSAWTKSAPSAPKPPEAPAKRGWRKVLG